MNNRMSYNDVEQLKRQIRARLGSAANDVMNMANGVSRGASYGAGFQGQSRQHQQPPQGGMAAQAGYDVQQRAAMPSTASSNMAAPQMKSSMVPPAAMKSSMTPPEPMKSPAMRTKPMAGGAHFDKYDCGHDYPKMSMQQHIKSELDTDNQSRAENLQYAVVMSEVLGEPVSLKRRRKRKNLQKSAIF